MQNLVLVDLGMLLRSKEIRYSIETKIKPKKVKVPFKSVVDISFNLASSPIIIGDSDPVPSSAWLDSEGAVRGEGVCGLEADTPEDCSN